jgi:hypothetical protein
LVGDLNDVQQLALVSALAQDKKEEFDRDWRNFVLAAVASHPENAKHWIKMLKPGEDGDEDAPLTEEDLEEYVPIQERQGLGDALRDLQRLGFAVTED